MKQNQTDNNNNMTKRRKAGRFWLIFVLSFIVVSMIASVIIYKIIFRRPGEENYSVEYCYQDLAADYPRRESDFRSGDNRLVGYFYGEDEDASGVVVVASGLKSGADTHLAEIMYFVDHGWEVFAYDGTGIRESEGSGIKGLPQMWLDLSSAIDCVQQQTSLPVTVYGHSAGGYAAALALSEKDIAGSVCIAGFNEPVETMYYQSWEYAGPLASLEYPFMRLYHWLTFGETGRLTAVDSINSSGAPIAIYQGEYDTVVPDPVSIFSHREEITNPEAEFHSLFDGHSTVWRSDAAEEYLEQLEEEFKALQKQYGRKLPQDILQSFRDSVDPVLANELDGTVMQEIMEFLNRAAETRA